MNLEIKYLIYPLLSFKRLEKLLEKNGFMISREFSGEITEVGKRYE